MRNGAAGLRRYGRSSTERTANAAPSSACGERTGALLVEADDVALAELARRGDEVLPLRDASSVHGDEASIEGAGLERREEIPVLGRPECHALALALHDEAGRHRLHATRGEPAGHLLPQHRRDLVAVQPIEDPAGLLCVDEALVDVARVLEGAGDGVLRDLVEDHPPHRHLGLQHLDEVPGDRLAFAVLVRCEEELVRGGEPLLEVGDDLLLPGIDDVVRLEVLRDVHPERAEPLALGLGNVSGPIGKVANVADARPDGVVAPEVTLDGSRLRRRLHDDEALAHRRNTLAPVSTVAGARYSAAWPRRVVRAGSTSSSGR